MKTSLLGTIGMLFTGVMLLASPAVLHAAELAKPSQPPLAQQTVREGDFAVRLLDALDLGTTEDEAEAESRLGEVGIAPRNGWIADYPVTPDIVAELEKSVGSAADADRIALDRDDALEAFNGVVAETRLMIRPYAAGQKQEAQPAEPPEYADETVIDDYYSTEGPPVVTYYVPPPDYFYLYAWVPFPFWWTDFWFPGFFVLRDFHRTVFVGHRVRFLSNHFNDFRRHRVFRVDPVQRFHGRTFAGIGVRDRRGFISTGIPRSERTIFNGNRTRMAPSGRTAGPRSGRGRMDGVRSGGGRGGGRMGGGGGRR